MKKYLFIAAAAIAVLSGCQKDAPLMEKDQPDAGKGLVFTASVEQNTKTTLATTADANYGKIYWENGDIISINGKDYTATKRSDATQADFKKVSEEATKVGGYYHAYYPASIYNGGTPTLPSTQTFVEEKFSNNPMYAKSESTSLTFKNICGILAVKVTSEDIATLKSIRVSSSNHDMCGAFTVNASNEAELTGDAGGNNSVKLVCDEALTLTAEGTTFYIAIPANTYRDLKIELSSDGSYYNRSMVTKPATDIAVARNKIYNIGFADNNYLCFTALTAGVGITMVKKGSITSVYEYSTDKSTWHDIGYDTPFFTLDGAGDKLYIRLKDEARKESQTSDNYVSFNASKPVEVSGNIMYLIKSDGTGSLTGYDFYYLFYDKDTPNIIRAGSLVLPAMTLAQYCYKNMFNSCSALTTAPALPATTLAISCYDHMFYRCGNITTAPVLPATTLVTRCYAGMFMSCTKLTSITCLATNINASNCTNGWVNGVSNPGIFTIASSAMETTWNGKAANAGKPSKFIYAYAH